MTIACHGISQCRESHIKATVIDFYRSKQVIVNIKKKTFNVSHGVNIANHTQYLRNLDR